MAAVALFRAGSEEEPDIQLILQGESSGTAGSNGGRWLGKAAASVPFPSLTPAGGGDLGSVTKSVWAFVSSEKWQ